MLELNLPPFGHKLKQKDGRLYIWDQIRKKYIVLQPEEWVRQHFVNYLVEHKRVPPALISLEFGRQYNTRAKRCDIIVWDTALKPLLLVECKASHIALSDKTFAQAAAYYSTLNTRYVALTNGMAHYFFHCQSEGFAALPDLPDFEEMGNRENPAI